MNLVEQQKNEIDIFNGDKIDQLMKVANLMAVSRVTVPKHLQGNEADCLAICMQAAQWGMSPFAVAQKTHLINGVLGYESQLVNAVISSSRTISGRFHYEPIGDWSKVAKKNFQPNDEIGLGVKVGAVLAGESELTWGDTVYLATVVTRNSPLWKTQPLQQLKYLALKYWARLYAPDVIMGVYDKEEVESFSQPEKDITPRQSDSLNSMFADKPVKADSKPKREKATETIEEAETRDHEPDIDDLTLIRDHIKTVTDKSGIVEAQEMFRAAQKSGKYDDAQLRGVYNEINQVIEQLKG